MSSLNEIWLAGERLDLDDETALLPTFQANDRAKADTIQSEYSPEFSAPGTARNHRLLKQAAAGQGSAYARVPAVLTSGGMETMPLGTLYVKGYKEGRYQLQLFGGNRRLVDALKKADGSDKMLADLDLGRFDHDWTPAKVLSALPYAHWLANGWGYELYDRGKPLDLQAVDPYTLYPSVRGELIWQQILADAGFTADSLLGEPLFAALNVPAANPYEFSQKFRDARQLTAGYAYAATEEPAYLRHSEGFDIERIRFDYTQQRPFHAPEAGTSGYSGGVFTADTLGYYDIAATIPTFFGCNERLPGRVRVKYMLLVNGKHLTDPVTGGELGKDEEEAKEYATKTFNPKLSRYLLKKGDTVELTWEGSEIKTGGISPNQPRWAIGPYGGVVDLHEGRYLASQVRLSATLLADFPPGGRVRLSEWLPAISQLDYVKAYMLAGGLTIQADDYEPHLHLATGAKLLANIPAARNWSAKRDAYAQPGRLPERDLAYRFGSYGQVNNLKWVEDEHVTKGYADGQLLVADEVLPAAYELATLPFAATEASTAVGGLLRILNYEVQDFTADPVTYSQFEAKSRLTLRAATLEVSGQLITVPQVKKPGEDGYQAATLASFTTTASHFDGVELSLDLNRTVLSTYWADLRAMLDEARYLTEYYRLTPRDIAELDFSVPIWDAGLGDYFAVSAVGEYDARRPVEVRLARLNAKYLPPPALPGGAGAEWYEGEFAVGFGEFY